MTKFPFHDVWQRLRRRAPSIRSHLALLIASIILPLIILHGWSAYADYRRVEAERAALLQVSAQSAAIRLSDFLAETEAMLGRLAGREAARSLQPEACAALFEDAMLLLPRFTNLLSVRRDGLVICSAVPMPEGELRHVQRQYYLDRLLARPGFTVGEPSPAGIASGRRHVALAVPLPGLNAEPAGALVLGADPERLALTLPMLPGVQAWVLSPAGHVVLAGRDQLDQIGEKFTSSAPDTQIVGQARVAVADWQVVVSEPRAATMVPARRQLLLALAFDGLVLLLAGLGAWLLGRRLYKPLEKLAHLADRVRQGDEGSRAAAAGPRELRRIAEGLNGMLDALARRQGELRQREERLGLAFVGNRDAIWDWDYPSGRVLFSDRWASMLDYLPGELPGHLATWEKLVHPDDLPRMRLARRDHLQGRSPAYECEYRLRCRDGHYKWILDRGAVVERSADGLPLRIIGTHGDIDARKAAEQKLSQAGVVFEKSPQAIMVTDARNIIRHVNPAFERVTGYSAAEAIGQNPALLSSGRQGAAFYADMWAAIARSGEWQGEVWNRRKDGAIYCEWLNITRLDDEAGGPPNGYIAMFIDITARKNAEALVRWQADYDALTSLPNRRLLLDRIEQAARQAQRQRDGGGVAGNAGQGAVLLLDLDHFKEVNDTLGHLAGDALLQEVAQRLQAVLRASDTVGRLGGDEFALLLPDLAPEAVPGVIQKLQAALAEPYSLEGRPVPLSGSIGAAVFPGDSCDANDLLRMADTAMYAAKGSERGSWRFFTPEMQSETERRVALIADLRQALAAGQFELFCQPIVTLEDGRLAKAEALLRWQHPSRGLVAPGEFIPLLEESGLIHEVGLWAIAEGLRLRRQLRDAGLDIELAVNVSTRQFERRDFVPAAVRLIEQSGLANPITLEVTESVALGDLAGARDDLERLALAGARIALDDFGTGYSSLSYLTALPATVLKIDRSFLEGAETDTAVARMVRAIIDLGHDLGFTVVAEGVETELQAAALRAMGCDLGQGYFFSRPLPFADLLRRYAPKPETV